MTNNISISEYGEICTQLHQAFDSVLKAYVTIAHHLPFSEENKELEAIMDKIDSIHTDVKEKMNKDYPEESQILNKVL